MPNHDMRALLASGKPLLCMNCFAGSPALIEILGYAGFDFVKLDMEHANNDFSQIEHLVRAADSANLTAIVRVAENSPVFIMKALDAGAAGVIVPHISSREDLERAVEYSLYAPKGVRGACSSVRTNRYGLNSWAKHVEQANRAAIVVPLLEDQAAIDSFDDLVAVPDVPLYGIGATDLAQSIGLSGADFYHPDLAALVKSLSARASKAGKLLMTTATPLLTPEYAAYLYSIGFGVVGFGADYRVIANAFQDISSKFHKLADDAPRAGSNQMNLGKKHRAV